MYKLGTKVQVVTDCYVSTIYVQVGMIQWCMLYRQYTGTWYRVCVQVQLQVRRYVLTYLLTTKGMILTVCLSVCSRTCLQVHTRRTSTTLVSYNMCIQTENKKYSQCNISLRNLNLCAGVCSVLTKSVTCVEISPKNCFLQNFCAICVQNLVS